MLVLEPPVIEKPNRCAGARDSIERAVKTSRLLGLRKCSVGAWLFLRDGKEGRCRMGWSTMSWVRMTARRHPLAPSPQPQLNRNSPCTLMLGPADYTFLARIGCMKLRLARPLPPLPRNRSTSHSQHQKRSFLRGREGKSWMSTASRSGPDRTALSAHLCRSYQACMDAFPCHQL